jgi:hypothetical protein
MGPVSVLSNPHAAGLILQQHKNEVLGFWSFKKRSNVSQIHLNCKRLNLRETFYRFMAVLKRKEENIEWRN